MTRKRAYSDVVLAAMPGTQAEIAKRTGFGQATVSRWCQFLCETGQAHIEKWTKPPGVGRQKAHYQPGPGANAAFVGNAKTSAQLARESRARRRREGSWEDRKAAERARYWANKPARRDPLVAALFGPYPAMAVSTESAPGGSR